MTSLVDIRTATDWLVLCDFDETFFAHDPAVRSRRDLADLAALVNSLSASRGLRFGFITGSAPSTVIAFPIYSGMRDSRRPRSFRPG
ncbi:putative hydrolase [Mycobacteroides abscessus subsp. abscessus]|nr:putative hydrolase [Mycobacteroides abscessus subsp. abscessus]